MFFQHLPLNQGQEDVWCRGFSPLPASSWGGGLSSQPHRPATTGKLIRHQAPQIKPNLRTKTSRLGNSLPKEHGAIRPSHGLAALPEGRGRGACWQPPLPPPALVNCRRPILIKLIKPAPFKELQPHATRGEGENTKLKGRKNNLTASTLLRCYPSSTGPDGQHLVRGGKLRESTHCFTDPTPQTIPHRCSMLLPCKSLGCTGAFPLRRLVPSPHLPQSAPTPPADTQPDPLKPTSPRHHFPPIPSSLSFNPFRSSLSFSPCTSPSLQGSGFLEAIYPELHRDFPAHTGLTLSRAEGRGTKHSALPP